MSFKVEVVPEGQRVATLSAQVAHPIATHQTWEVFDNKESSLPVVSTPIGLPVYRMNNGRTRSTQLQYMEENQLPADFFAAGQENEQAQQAQHEILEVFAAEGSDNVTPILDVLEHETQREPIIVSPSGVVLNGNRRLAAMRLLFDRDPSTFSSYANVDCAVLPTLTPEQSLDMEVRLQMKQKTLLEYSWVDEALTIEEALRLGRTRPQIAALMNQTPQAVNVALGRLAEARLYLQSWVGQPASYSLVKGKQQFFGDLAKSHKNKSASEVDAARRIAWIVEGSGDRPGGRVYNYNFVFGEKVDVVVDRVGKRVGGLDGAAPASDEDLIVDFGEDDAEPDPFLAFVRAAHDESLRDKIVEVVEEIADELVVEKANEKSAAQPLKIIKRARASLESVQVKLAPSDSIGEMISQLDGLIQLGAELKALAETRSKQP